MKDKVIAPLVEVELQLISRDDAIKGDTGIPNRNKPGKAPFKNLSKDDYKRVQRIAKKTLNIKQEKNSLILYLYFRADDTTITGITLLDKPVFKETIKGNFIYSFKVFYSLKESIKFNQLRKQVDEIADHWRWSGDVAYRVTKFKFINTPQLTQFGG